MTEVGAFEDKNKLSALLDRVEQGEEIVITRHGRPVARLVPNAGGIDLRHTWPSNASDRAYRRSNLSDLIGPY